MNRAVLRVVVAIVVATVASGCLAEEFVYRGTLKSAGLPSNGSFEFVFRAFDAENPDQAMMIGSAVRLRQIEVREGNFVASLDFGHDLSDYEAVWLEIDVARSDGIGGFSTLSPRQKILSPASPDSTQSVPGNAVMYFNLAACPSGWRELPEARGRTIVGLQPGGALLGTVGDQLSDLQGQAHRHQLSSTTNTSSDGYHNHQWSELRTNSSDGKQHWISYNSNGNQVLAAAWGNGVGNEGSGHYPLSATPGNSFYTMKTGTHSHSLGTNVNTEYDFTSALPYVQLLTCIKD